MIPQNGYVIELPKDVYLSVWENMHPACRFINVEEWKFKHFWMRSGDGSVVVFVPSGTEHTELKGFTKAS